MANQIISSSRPNWLNMLGIGLPIVPDVSFYYLDAVESIDGCFGALKARYSDISDPNYVSDNSTGRSQVYQRITEFTKSNTRLKEPSDLDCLGAVAVFSPPQKKDLYLILKMEQEMVPLITCVHEEVHVAQLYGLESTVSEKMKRETGVEIDFSKISDIEVQAYIPGIHMLVMINTPLELIYGKHGSAFEAARGLYFNEYLKVHPKKEHELFMATFHL
jgi:hypothetical protein